ncbi:hypothetical protein WMY93_005209 [Mugilogobius chulae]|uniref:Brinker DNA-binding domain-containing protein n=1 Tax=Mugilogobius chulae TaxID=88201 RepID=A0AAW0PTB5_9GOBI
MFEYDSGKLQSRTAAKQMPPVRRHAYDADLKLKAISHANEHRNRAAVRKYNINESMVRKWRKQEDDLRQAKKTTQSFRGNNTRWPQLEDKIEQWVMEQRAAGRSISTVLIRMKATTLDGAWISVTFVAPFLVFLFYEKT